ncbi:MAG: glycosyltransferase [Deltaproteobacteria bacterium]|nr:glycosyltransferase [Deltaproteobacteria bacterium]
MITTSSINHTPASAVGAGSWRYYRRRPDSLAAAPLEVVLRFCMITTFYPPHHFGGDAIAIRRLCHGLVRAGHQVEVICDVDAWRTLSDGEEPLPLEEPEGLTVHRLRSRLPSVAALMTHQLGRPTVHRRRIEQIVEAGRFDVINFHNVSLVGGPGLLSVGGPDVVKLYMAHEHWLVCPTHVLWRHGREACPSRECLRCTAHHRRPPQLWRSTGALGRALDHVHEFLAISQFSADKHREFGFPKPMTVLPYGLPDREDGEVAGGAAHSRPYFLYVGRLEAIKGLDDVIPAMAGYPDADLLIAGSGSHEDALRAAGEGLDNVHFLGWVESARLRSYYRDCLALIVPSVCFETFGIILAEAFRDGTPVIARDIGPFPELIATAQGGELFSTPAELLSAMGRMQQDEGLRRRQGVSARAAWEANWSEAVVIPAYLQIARRVRRRLNGSAT